MTVLPRALQRLLAPNLAAILVATGLAVPLLDGFSPFSTPVLESEHHATECVVGHDHSICTQAGANRWFPGTEDRPRPPEAAVADAALPPAAAGVPSVPRTDARPRAPPVS